MYKKILSISGVFILLIFASQFLTSVSHGDINITNTGNVQINSTTQCNTGNNTIAGQNSGVVINSQATTGNANCGTTVQTTVNTNTVIVGNPTSTPTPSVDPCIANPASCITPTPTQTPSNGGGSGGGSGSGSSGSSNGSGTSASSGSSAPIQAVLGASTMAATGTFETNLMNVMLLVGILFFGAGIKSYAKEKNN